MSLELMLIRHGESEYDLDPRRIGGWSEEALTERGRKQAHALRARLRREVPDPVALFTSPLPRAEQTATILGGGSWPEPSSRDGLKERNKGELTGLTREEVKRDLPEFFEAKLPPDTPWPGGESYVSFHERVAGCLRPILEAYADGLVVVVTHAGPINVFLREISSIPVQEFRAIRVACHDTSVHHFRRTGEGWRILGLNDTRHL